MKPGKTGLFQSTSEKYTLSRNISAIQVTSSMEGQAELGMLVQLPQGAHVELCGDGFNAKTAKVRSGGTFYFVFREDLGVPVDAEPRCSFAQA